MKLERRICMLLASVSLMVAPLPAKTDAAPKVPEVKWDSRSLIVDGKRVVPVMGEVHYSRIPADEWEAEVRKMKDGGVTMIANYVFWNHVEEQEGVFDWSGQRDLRRFLEICRDEGMPVVLRIGPYCHGEARCGGIPDWVFTKGCRTRDANEEFMSYTGAFYRQIYSQIIGMQWKDGGPVIAVQFDNEQRNGAYLMALKELALSIGFDLPFYTRTGWPELTTPVPFGEMLPLFGDYADGFWDRSIEETTGDYYKAFNFKAFRRSTAIATDQFGKQTESDGNGDEDYPYFTCELGGGMIPSYHRRVYVYPEDAYAMAVVKLGSGSNLLGYYMYHGGTNPEGKFSYLNESQNTVATNHNDLPVKSYEYYAPIGEYGQLYPHYFMLRKLHLFMHDFGETLAPMDPVFPCPQNLPKGDDSGLRWSYRSLGDSAFVFVNNYERLQNLSDKKGVQFDVCGVRFPRRPMTIPAGTSCIFPVNIGGITYATAQIVARRDGKIYLEQIEGIPTEICVDGKTLRNLKPGGTGKPVYGNIYLLDSETAGKLFLTEEKPAEPAVPVVWTKLSEAGEPRQIRMGAQNVAEQPSDSDFADAAVYSIELPDAASRDGRILQIGYRGDVARLYADGKLVADNFYNGRPFLLGLWRLPEECTRLELRILPLQENMPVYFPREARAGEPGEEVYDMTIFSPASYSMPRK